MMNRTGFSAEDRALVLRILKKLKKLCRLKGKDIHLVEKAYTFANDKHNGVRRKDVTPYIRRSRRGSFTTRWRTRM